MISDAIESMGDPTHKSQGASRGSVTLRKSFADWWAVDRSSQAPFETAVHSAGYAAARAKNLAIERSLFRSIFSRKVRFEGEAPAGQPLVARFLDTPVPSGAPSEAPSEAPSCYVHELELSNKTDPSLPQKHIVVIHGYMAAMGYFAKNIESLAASYAHVTVHVLDLPGFGNSARPTFPPDLLGLAKNASQADEIRQVVAAESWFIDKIEAWRQARHIERFDLVAHSMGAYLSCCYLMKHNNDAAVSRVSKFVLVSPMGTEPSDISLINNTKLQFNHHDIASNPLHEVFAAADFDEHSGRVEELAILWDKLGRPRFPKNAFLRFLWNNHISPFQVLQYSGPLYSKLLSFWSFQRFSNLSSDAEGRLSDNTALILLLHDYSFSIFNQYQASGELAITKFINHEIVPRLPLCDRGFVEYLQKTGISTLWMYGDKDWMNHKGGEYCVEKLNAVGASARLEMVKGAGHHIYLDNPETFNQSVIDFLDY